MAGLEFGVLGSDWPAVNFIADNGHLQPNNGLSRAKAKRFSLLFYYGLRHLLSVGPAKLCCQFSNETSNYSFTFESADGTKVSESRQVGPKLFLKGDIGTVSKGSYSYTSPDGVVLTVNWVADENRFQATSDNLPTPVLPMPQHIIKLLADLEAIGVL